MTKKKGCNDYGNKGEIKLYHKLLLCSGHSKLLPPMHIVTLGVIKFI